jgi:hypothetical protein
MRTWILLGLRWSARITGLLLVALVLLIAAGEGVFNPLKAPAPVQVESVALILILVGFLVGWRSERLGALLALVGFAVFTATELAVNGKPPGGAIPLMAVPGILYLASYGVGLKCRTGTG